MMSFLGCHDRDLIGNPALEFIHSDDFDSPQLSSTPLPSNLSNDFMDHQLLNILLQEPPKTSNYENPHQMNEQGLLFLSSHGLPSQHQRRQSVMARQQQFTISSMIASTTGSLFSPLGTLTSNPYDCRSLVPLHALNAPPTMMQSFQNPLSIDKYLGRPSITGSSGQRSGLKRPRQASSSSPEPLSTKAKKEAKKETYGQVAAAAGRPKDAHRPVTARALALDKEVLRLHEIDRPVAERMIRDKLGNNPDTSKSLRRLALEGKVVRYGVGGRGEPFRYELTELGKEVYLQIKEARDQA